jgi:hypothetical protein
MRGVSKVFTIWPKMEDSWKMFIGGGGELQVRGCLTLGLAM